MSELPNQEPQEKQVVVGEPVTSSISWKRVFVGLLCGAFFFAVGFLWKDSVALGILFGIVAFLIGYFSGKAIY